jgi:nitroreductase
MRAGRTFWVFVAAGLAWAELYSQEAQPVPLPPPDTTGGMPLMQALHNRQSTRRYSDRKLSEKTLSNLLWSAFGVNRQARKMRTAPSAMNRQEIEVYAAMREGLFRYDAFANRLQPVLSEDIRALTGKQDFVSVVPVNLIYVATVSMDTTVAEAERIFYPAADCGFISQNVYLFCASEGLGTVVRGMVDKPALAKKMGLRPDQRILLAQSVGYPAP